MRFASICSVIGGWTAIGPANLVHADDEATSLGVTLEAQVASSYVNRGDSVGEDDTDPWLFTIGEIIATHLGPGDAAVGFTTALPTRKANHPSLEIDPYVAYTFPDLAGILDLSFNYVLTTTPNAAQGEPIDAAHEFGIEGTLDFGLPLTLTVASAIDPVCGKGAYSFAALAWETQFDDLTLAADFNVGVSMYDGVELGLQDITLTAGAAYAVTDLLYVAIQGGAAYQARAEESLHVHPWVGFTVGMAR